MVQSTNMTLIFKVMQALSILSSSLQTELLTHPSRGERTSSNCIQTLLSCLPNTTVALTRQVDARRRFCTHPEAELARINVRDGNLRWFTHAGRCAPTRNCNCSTKAC